jgi:hypothetical protein
MFSLNDVGFLGSLRPGPVSDSDAETYLRAVETADANYLEPAVRDAVNAFVVGCKADGIWSAIKASCILAGARTLNGALVPLVGTAPTNFNFVSGDYNRKTGLVGNGSTKYLNSNRNNNTDTQNNQHLAVFPTVVGTGTMLASRNASTPFGASQINISAGTLFLASRLNVTQAQIGGTILASRICGVSRSAPGNFGIRYNSISSTHTDTSSSPNADSVNAFNRGGILDSFGTHRLAFYSIGESLDLALLDARVTTLINAFDAAI